MTGRPIAQASNGVTCGRGRRHFVHVYAVIRVKVEVDAPDHRRAMEAADELLFGDGLAVRLVPMKEPILDAEYAEEVTAYLVDEADDPEFEHSSTYGADYEPDRARHTTPSPRAWADVIWSTLRKMLK